MRENLYFIFVAAVLRLVADTGMGAGAIDALRKTTRVLLAQQAVLRHMVGSDKETFGGDQESGSQTVALPIAFPILVLHQDFQAFRPEFRPGKLSSFSRKLFGFGEIIT